MKNPSRFTLSSRQTGFSLVEMIGVLAIIAVLAVIIVPKVFSTIASSRITSAAASVGAMKSAVVEYASKYGSLPITVVNSRLDDVLLADSLIDGRFSAKIGTPQTIPAVAGATYNRTTSTWTGGASQANQTRLICLASTTAVPSASAGANYRLNGGNVNLPAGARVASAVIVGVTGTEARELSLRIDGDAFTAANAAAADDNGKVVYAAPAAGITTVYIYIAHQ